MSDEPNSTTSATASAKPPHALKRRTLTKKQRRQPKIVLGEHGEATAARYLQDLGYELIDNNLRFHRFEVDLIAKDIVHGELVFIEVKTRSGGEHGHPSSAVGWKKRRSMEQFANNYLRKTNCNLDYRFDMICIVHGRVEHYQNISWNA